MNERHPADSTGLRVVAKPPTSAPIVCVRDVLIVTTGRAHEASHEDYVNHPPCTESGTFDLGSGVLIARLSDTDAELVMDACEPRGHFYYARRVYGQRYAYVTEPPRDAWERHPSGWDPDGRINAAFQLSRLVHDNTDSMEYAARIYYYEGGPQQVTPRHDCELGRAYWLDRGRDWLDHAEAETLRELLAAYWQVESALPARIRRALRRTMHISTERYLDDWLSESVIALESLVNTGPDRPTKQFVDRVRALGADLGVPASGTYLGEMYAARSQGLHGADIALASGAVPPPDAVEKIARLHRLLRRAVRRAIEIPEFRARLESDATVDAWMPLSGD